MIHTKTLSMKIACSVSKATSDTLEALLKEFGLDWDLQMASDCAGLIDIADAGKAECVVYEVYGRRMEQKAYRALLDSSQHIQAPVVLYAGHQFRKKLREEVRHAGCDGVHVVSGDEEELIAALDIVAHAARVEENLRTVNQRLAEVVEERARSMHENEKRYRFLFDSCNDAVMVVTVDEQGENGVVEEANGVACKWFGYMPDAAVAVSLRQLFNFGPSESALKIEGILTHGSMYLETLFQRTDGAKIPVEAITESVALSGNRFRVFILARRLSDRSASQDKMVTNEDYRFVASQTGLLMYEGDLKTHKMIWGGAVSQITGLSPHQLMRGGFKGWRERIISEDYHHVISAVNDAIKRLGKYEIEYRIKHKSGEIRHVEDHGVVLPDESGQAARLLGTLKDITLRMQAQEQRQRFEVELQHSQRLESLGVLAGGIAHDFNNILAGIIGLTDLALREVPADSFVHEDLTEVLQAANRAKELVRQILAFSRQSGQERNPIYLHIIAREVIKLLRASLPPTIEIVDSADVHSGAIMANAAQMYQIITNFSTNAAHAMAGKEGKIEIRVVDMFLNEKEAARFPELNAGPYVKLSVMDTGHGMAQPVLDRVFDPFFTTKGPGEGTGMGLAVVHGIIKDHGGVVTAQSRLGQGSTFDVYVPRIAGVKVEEEQQVEKLRGGTERILFVDDDMAVLRFAESALPRLGFRLTLCKNGEDGLRKVIERPGEFDLVITDQVMPKMSGMELAKEIHVREPQLPIILFTGFSDEMLPEALASSGIFEVVSKPIVIRDLVETIQRAVSKNPKSEFED